MFIEDFFFRLPVRDGYRETHHKSVFLRAHPTVARLCFLLEMFISITVFIYSFQVTSKTETIETKVSYEPSHGYDCNVLSPLSTSVEYSILSSEMAQFSRMRWNYNECIDNTKGSGTGSDSSSGTSSDSGGGYDLCSDTHRQDYLLSVYGIDADDMNCYYEVFLRDGYRFCYGHNKESELESELITTSFPRSNKPTNILLSGSTSFSSSSSSSSSSTSTTSGHFFFMNGSELHIINNPSPAFSDSQRLTHYISDYDSTVFVMATSLIDNKNALYSFTIGKSKVTKLYQPGIEFTVSTYYGLTYHPTLARIYLLGIAPNGGAKVAFYDLKTSFGQSPPTLSWPCDNFSPTESSSTTTSSNSVNYLTTGSNGKVYVMCSSQTALFLPGSSNTNKYTFYEIDTLTHNRLSYSIDLFAQNYTNADGSNSKRHVNTISRIFQDGSYFYFIGSNDYSNIFRTSMQGSNAIIQQVSPSQRMLLSPIEYVGRYQGLMAIETPSQSHQIYFIGSGDHLHYDTVKNSFAVNEEKAKAYYFYATHVQLAYSYQICNGNDTKYVIDYSLETSFRKKCNDINGVYYQTNAYYEVPTSCTRFVNNSQYARQLFQCEDLLSQMSTFVSETCSDSLTAICTSAYTDNPPFSCERTTYPTYVTIIATALANTSGAWTFTVLVLKLMMKMIYPHGYHEFIYNEETGSFLPMRKATLPSTVTTVAGVASTTAATDDDEEEEEEDDDNDKGNVQTPASISPVPSLEMTTSSRDFGSSIDLSDPSPVNDYRQVNHQKPKKRASYPSTSSPRRKKDSKGVPPIELRL